MKKKKFIDLRTGLIIGSSSAAGLAIISTPAFAQDSAVDDVSSTISAIGTITGVAATVVIGALGVRLAIKQVNRIMTKG